MALIESKIAGKKVVETPTPHVAPVIDIMEALKASLARVRGEDDGAADDGAADDGDDLGELSRDELYERAQEAGVPGRSSMSKDELIDALSG